MAELVALLRGDELPQRLFDFRGVFYAVHEADAAIKADACPLRRMIFLPDKPESVND